MPWLELAYLHCLLSNFFLYFLFYRKTKEHSALKFYEFTTHNVMENHKIFKQATSLSSSVLKKEGEKKHNQKVGNMKYRSLVLAVSVH